MVKIEIVFTTRTFIDNLFECCHLKKFIYLSRELKYFLLKFSNI